MPESVQPAGAMVRQRPARAARRKKVPMTFGNTTERCYRKGSLPWISAITRPLPSHPRLSSPTAACLLLFLSSFAPFDALAGAGRVDVTGRVRPVYFLRFREIDSLPAHAYHTVTAYIKLLHSTTLHAAQPLRFFSFFFTSPDSLCVHCTKQNEPPPKATPRQHLLSPLPPFFASPTPTFLVVIRKQSLFSIQDSPSIACVSVTTVGKNG